MNEAEHYLKLLKPKSRQMIIQKHPPTPISIATNKKIYFNGNILTGCTVKGCFFAARCANKLILSG
jgi:hypothetical protein